jgi:hypothetical protein
VLGGYPGAILLPAVTGVLSIPARGRPVLPAPYLLGALFAVASVVGAVGEHLEFSGDTGRSVIAVANAIPQVICLMVVGGLAAVLCRQALCRQALCRPPMRSTATGSTATGSTATGEAE